MDAALHLPPPATVVRVFLIRHGSTEANERLPFVLQGCELDGPLSENGRRQAAALARFLAPFEFAAIYSSPMRRTLETVSPIAESRGLAVASIDALRECSVGRWAGLSWDEIRKREPRECQRFLADPADVRHPDGESYRDLASRVTSAIQEILLQHRGQNILIMAHNMVNRVLLAGMLGVDLRNVRRIRQTNCCINVLEHREEVTEVLTVNSVWHLNDA